MIKKLLTIFSLAATLAGTAQQNLDFETWANGTPTGWTAPFSFFAAGSVTQETVNPGEALSSVQLQTTACPFCFILSLPPVVPGIIQQKVAFTSRPTSVSVKLRATIDAGDEGLFAIQTTLWDSAGATANPVGGVGVTIPGGTVMNTWQNQTLPYQYMSASNPDTLLIVALSSDSLVMGTTTQSVNSVLAVDAIVLNYPAGISEVLLMGSDYLAYPNPATDELNIVSKNSEAKTVNVYDIAGRLVKTEKIENGKTNISLVNLGNGLYVYSIIDNNNVVLNTDKFVIAK